jgi:hypothetical protein
MGRTVHRDRFSDKEPSPRGLVSYLVNAGAAVSFSPAPNYFSLRRYRSRGLTKSTSKDEAVQGVGAAPPSSVMNSRRRIIRSPRQRER